MIELNIKSSYEPQQAIIVYYSKQDEAYYLENHSVYTINNKSVLSEGKPLSKGTIENIAAYYYTESTQAFKPKKLLPKNLLYAESKIGSHLLVWHKEAAAENLYFSESLGIQSGLASCPHLLFVAINDTLHVFALADGQVSLSSKLYIAPFHNVSPDGKVCLGNARIGKVHHVEYEQAMAEWEKAFFNSEFTSLHSGDSPTKSNVNTLWKNLIESGDSFPTGELKEHAYQSVERLIHKL